MVVYLLRHCESIFNIDQTSDIKDCGLTEKGIQQAKLLKGYYDEIICSPMLRAKQTLEYSNIKSVKRTWYWDEIREVKKDMCDFKEGEEFVIENEDSILERVKTVKEHIKYYLIPKNELKKPIGSLLIIGHADFFWYLTSKIKTEINEEGFEMDERFGIWLDNGELYEMESVSLH